jgi:D-aminoacyl-tRNA deacylase
LESKSFVALLVDNSANHLTIVSSTQDPASQNITKSLIAKHRFEPSTERGVFVHPNHSIRIVTVEKPGIYVEPNEIASKGSAILFASKHVSAANRPAMTVHATGNLGRIAEFGGRPEEVSLVNPSMIRRALKTMSERVAQAGIGIDVTMEATHHGPTSFPVPICFVEIGSGPREWTDPVLGEIAADALFDAATVEHEATKAAVAFGGTHYSAKFTRICLEGDYLVGHVIPRHAIEAGVTDMVIKDTLAKTIPTCDTGLIDWKGLNGEDRRTLVAKLENWGYSITRC